ncbi:hypothetical protein [Planococcus sp. CP5-4_UN]|nr:hypothetical protein [Planococcus sp. CP5-4_UN]
MTRYESKRESPFLQSNTNELSEYLEKRLLDSSGSARRPRPRKAQGN